MNLGLLLLSLALGLASADEHFRKASSCVDLFTYKMTQYTGCTDDHSPGKPWCSMEETYEDGSDRWMYCTKIEVVPAGYFHHRQCVFPFVYNRQEFNSCTKENSDEYWCATTKNYTGSWKHCPKSQTIIPCCETDLINLNKYVKNVQSTPGEKKKGVEKIFDEKNSTCFVSKKKTKSPSFTIEMKEKTFIDNIRFKVCASPASTISNYDVFVSDKKRGGWKFAFYNVSQIPLKPNQEIEVSIMKNAKFVKFVVYGYKTIAIQDVLILGRECKCPQLEKKIECCDIPQRSIIEQAVNIKVRNGHPKSPSEDIFLSGLPLSDDKCFWTKESANPRLSIHFKAKHQIYSVFLTAGPKSSLHYITVLARQDDKTYKKCGELKSIEGIPSTKIPCQAYTSALRVVHSYYGTLSLCNIKILAKSVNCKCSNETSIVKNCCKGPLEDLIARNYKSLKVPASGKGKDVPNMLNGERHSYYQSKNGNKNEKIKFILPRLSYVEKIVMEAPEEMTLGQFKVLYKVAKKPLKEIFAFKNDKSEPGEAFDIFIKKNVNKIVIQNMKKGNKLSIARFQVMGRRCDCTVK